MAPAAGSGEPGELGRLRWRCRRGMRELDELLTRYVECRYASASAAHQHAFCELLDSQDPLIYAYLLGQAAAPDAVWSALIAEITMGSPNT